MMTPIYTAITRSVEESIVETLDLMESREFRTRTEMIIFVVIDHRR